MGFPSLKRICGLYVRVTHVRKKQQHHAGPQLAGVNQGDEADRGRDRCLIMKQTGGILTELGS